MHTTKKMAEKKRVNNLKRAFNPMNTGTRTMKSNKDYKRIKKWETEE